MRKEKHFNCREWEYDEQGNRGITCNTCKTFKTEDNYSRNVTAWLGIKTSCKDCYNLQKKSWSKTKEGVIQTIWDAQKRSCKTRRMQYPSYSKEWFFEWCLNQDLFHILFEDWINSNYEKRMKPSVDRKDNFISYEKDNIQLMTWGENERKGNKDLRRGQARYNYTNIIQLSKEGHLIKEFKSITQAGRELNIPYQNIQKCCKGERKTAGGFRWKFTEKEITNE
jgi:hypothetical protein